MSDPAHRSAEQELILVNGNSTFLSDYRRWLVAEVHAFWFLLCQVLVLGALAALLTVKMSAVSRLHRELQADGIVLKGTATSLLSLGGGEAGLTPYARCTWTANGGVFEKDYQLLEEEADNGRIRQGQEIELLCLARDPSQCELRDQFLRSGSPLARMIVVWAGVLAAWAWSFAELFRIRTFRTKGTLTTGRVTGFECMKMDASRSPTMLRIAYSFDSSSGITRYGESVGNPRNMVVSGHPWSTQNGHSDPKSHYIHVLHLPDMRHLVL